MASFLAIAMRAGMSGVVATAGISYGIAAACLVTVPRRRVPDAQPVPTAAVGA
jgi:hypothetical protein